jgi:hypothetical protein
MVPERQKAVEDILFERNSQPAFDDSLNTEGLWVSYIVNYASRWAMPFMFDTQKYFFRTCMVKVGALCVAAIEWCDKQDTKMEDTHRAREVADSIK